MKIENRDIDVNFLFVLENEFVIIETFKRHKTKLKKIMK